jgi:hypothetical protein
MLSKAQELSIQNLLELKHLVNQISQHQQKQKQKQTMHIRPMTELH